MPSINPATALLRIYCTSDAAPWRWPTWQDLTGVHHGLFPHDDAELPPGWTRQNANDVLSFFRAFRDIEEDDKRIAFAETKKGNSDYPGRDFFKNWIGSLFKKAGIHNIIVSEFKAGNIHPGCIYIREGAWPPANDYLALVIDGVAMRLFGEEAFDSVLGRVCHQYRTALKALMQQSWTKIRNQINYMKTSSLRIEIAARSALLTLRNEEVTKAKVAAAIRAVARWKECLELTKTQSEVQEAQGMLEELDAIMQDLRVGAKITKKGLDADSRPNVFNRAVVNLASKENVTDLLAFYREYFESNLEDEGDVILSEDFTLTNNLESKDKCDFGMEIESTLTKEALGLRLGIGRECYILLFNLHRHLSGITPWEDEKQFVVGDGPLPSHLAPLSLHWHQLAGIHSILRSLFSDKPDEHRPVGVLVADAVGLGKTCQSIAIIAMLIVVIFCQEGRYKLPPIIGERPYFGTEETVPKLPHLIVCPGTLTNQWISEIKTLCIPGSVDIFVYDSQTDSSAFWGPSGPLTSSNHDLQFCIIVATHSAIWNDFRHLHYPVASGVNSRPWDIPKMRLPSGVRNTVFDQQFLTIIVDEAHHMRNGGNRHAAILRLLNQGKARIIMTATPLLTAPKDVASMARLVGIKHFFSKISHQEEKEDAKVMRRLKKLDDNGEALSQERLKIVARHQNHCRGHLLRRSATSTNNDNAPLLDLPPYREIIGLVELTEREKVIIDERSEAAKAAVLSASDARIHTKKFYLEYWLAVGYAKDDASSLLPSFKSLKEWNMKKSTKMDVCANICAHYLAGDRVDDVSFQDGDVIFPHIPAEYSNAPQKTRKIIIYAEFPSMAPLLQNVLSLYSLDSLAINGKNTFKQRDRTIKKFYDDNHPARILLFSSVGSAGLNLAIADVVILFDQPWSSQDECQIIGHAHRQPQQKEVKAIYLHAKDSADVLIWEMARGKSAMFDAFVDKEKAAELRALLQGQVLHDGKLVEVPNETNEDDDNDQVPARPRRRRAAAINNDSDSEPRPTRAPRRPRRQRRPVVVDEDEPSHGSPSTGGEAADSIFGPSDGNASEVVSTGTSTPSTNYDDMPGLHTAPNTTTDEESSYAGHTNHSESELDDVSALPDTTASRSARVEEALPPPHLSIPTGNEPDHVPSPDTRHIQESDEAPRHPQAPSVTNNPYGDLPPSDDAIEFYPSPVNEDQDEDQDEDMSDAPPLLDHGKVDDEPEPTPDSVMPELPLPEDGAAGGGSHLREAIQYAVTNRRGLLFRPNMTSQLPSTSTTRGDQRPPSKRSRLDVATSASLPGAEQAKTRRPQGTSRPSTSGAGNTSLPSAERCQPEAEPAPPATPDQKKEDSRPVRESFSRQLSTNTNRQATIPPRVERQLFLPGRSTGPSEPIASTSKIFNRCPEDFNDQPSSTAPRSKPNPFAKRPSTAPGSTQTLTPAHKDLTAPPLPRARVVSSSGHSAAAATSSTAKLPGAILSNAPFTTPAIPRSSRARVALPATRTPTNPLPAGANAYDIPPMSAMMGLRSEPKDKGKGKEKEKGKGKGKGKDTDMDDAWPEDSGFY